MLGNKSASKYHSFYFVMHCVNFFSTNLLNVKLVVLCFFLIFFFKGRKRYLFNLKLCNKMLIPGSNKILRFSIFSHFIINVGEQIRGKGSFFLLFNALCQFLFNQST